MLFTLTAERCIPTSFINAKGTRLQPLVAGGGGLAWLRLMGVVSVAYHEETVMRGRDDFPRRAFAYYAARGEAPLVWGGAGAARLGLVDAVTEGQYRA